MEGATTERKIKVGGPMQSGGKDRRDNLRKLHDHTTIYLDYSVYFEIICFVIVSLSLARDNFIRSMSVQCILLTKLSLWILFISVVNLFHDRIQLFSVSPLGYGKKDHFIHDS